MNNNKKHLGIKKDQSLHDYSFWMRVFKSNEVGSYLAGFILKHNMRISPNAVTLTGTILNLVSAIILVAPVPLHYKSICVFFLWFALITDYIDGVLARETNTGTKFGHWFDNIQVHYLHLLIPTSVILSIYTDYENSLILFYLLFVLLVSQLYRWSYFEMTRILLENKVKDANNQKFENDRLHGSENKQSILMKDNLFIRSSKSIIYVFQTLSETNWKVALFMFCFIVPYFTWLWAILIPLSELICLITFIIRSYIKYSKVSDII